MWLYEIYFTTFKDYKTWVIFKHFKKRKVRINKMSVSNKVFQ